jgi:hypothetical protein
MKPPLNAYVNKTNGRCRFSSRPLYRSVKIKRSDFLYPSSGEDCRFGIRQAKSQTRAEQLLGVEGSAIRIFFKAFGSCFYMASNWKNGNAIRTNQFTNKNKGVIMIWIERTFLRIMKILWHPISLMPKLKSISIFTLHAWRYFYNNFILL